MSKRDVTVMEWRGRQIVVADSQCVELTRHPVDGIFGHEGVGRQAVVSFHLDYADDPRGQPAQVFAEAQIVVMMRITAGGVYRAPCTFEMDDPYQMRDFARAIMQVADELSAAQQMIAEMGSDASQLLLPAIPPKAGESGG